MPPLADYPLADAYFAPRGGGAEQSSRAQRVEGDLYASRGTLSNVVVRGRAQLLEHGSLSSGQDGYNDGTGFWLEANAGLPRFSIGNSAADHMTWNGTALDIVGSMTATTGSIAGWTINTDNLDGGDATLHSSGYLNLGTGNNIVRADAANATYRLWVGNATASSAPFSVDKTGAMASVSGNIGGWAISSAALSLGSGATTRGMDSGSVAFFAGNSVPGSAPFRVETDGTLRASDISVTGGTVTASAITTGTLNFGSSGTVNTTGTITGTFGGINIANLTVTGNITVGSGGKILFGSGADDYLDDNILHFEVGTSQIGKLEFKNASNTPYGSIEAAASSTIGDLWIFGRGTGGRYSSLQVEGTSTGAGATLQSIYDATNFATITTFASSSGGSIAFALATGSATLDLSLTNHAASFRGRIYPGTGSAQQSTGYMDWDGSATTKIRLNHGSAYLYLDSSGRTVASGNIFPGGQINEYVTFSTHLGFGGLTLGGSVANWSAGWAAGAYFLMAINGTVYRVPYFGDA